MNTQDLIRAIHRLKVETGSLACFGCGYEHSCSVRGCAILRSAAAALEKNQWINVKDRMPERTLPPKDVLVYHDLGCGMFVDRAWYSYDKKRWCSVLGMKLKVTHWMPLPDPPKENDYESL